MKTGLVIVAILAVAVSCVSANISVKMGRHPDQVLPHGSTTDQRHTVKLNGGLLSVGAYFAEVAIGTPPQTFTVLIDTGSSNLAVGGIDCSAEECGKAVRYDHTKSASATPITCTSAACQTCHLMSDGDSCLFARPFCYSGDSSLCGGSISYGGSSSFISGYWVNDVVTFGNYTTTTGILAINAQTPAQNLASGSSGGILGLAHEWNAVNPTYIPTLFKNIVDAGLSKDVFSMCLSPASGGVLDLGFIDPTKYTGMIQYVPVTQQRWYNIGLKDIKFNGISIGLTENVYWVDNDSIGTFIDSGTSVMLFAPIIYQAIVSTWQSNFCSLPGVCGSNTIFEGTCLTAAQKGALDSYPDFEFTFAGENGADVKLTVPATSYMMEQGGQFCWSSSAVTGINGVLGDVFLENYYTIYDRANQRIGFADIGNCQ